ncbi:MAG TPA: phosphohistidine phosphatase SixA [Polyangia bacterium]|nr:phosphohistidine phosphatase SixA [Polyangia bacterium]
MRVTLIRHAEAGDDAPRDEARALTARGRQDARRMGRALARRDVTFSVIVTSPLVRAVQTAEIVAAMVDYRERIVVTDALVPEAAVSQAVGFLASMARDPEAVSSVALVAHEPILSALAAELTGRPRHPPLKKAEALRIRMESKPGGPPGAGTAKWRIDARGRRERL